MVAVTKTNVSGDSCRVYGYLSTLSETVVMVGEVNTVPDDTIKFLLYTLLSGSEAAVRYGMEIEVFDGATGASKGRLRAAGVASGGNIQVNEFSLGRLNVAIGDELHVYRSFRVHDRLVKNSPQFERDSRYAYVDELETFDPIACSGGVYANFVSKAGAVGFPGADSRTNDPDSSGAVSHDWTFPSGTPSTSASASPTVDYSGAAAGTYTVTHVVEDDTNLRTATQYIPVILHDDANPPFQCLADFSGNRDDGDCRATFTVVADAITDLPDGALVVFWLDEHFGTTNASYGNEIPTRSHIKFVGYLVKDSVQADWFEDTVTFDAISPLGILKQLAGSSQAITAASDPDSWLTMQSPTVNRVIWYLLYWNCTILLSHDLLLPADSPLYPAFYVQEADFYNQVRELADAVDCQFVCSRTGRLHVNKPLALADASERSAAVTVMTLDSDDIVPIDIVTEHRTPINLVEGRGITEGLTDSAAVFSRAPGNAPAEGAGRAFFERKIVRANPNFQGDLNVRTGRSYARVNGLYYGLLAPRGIRVTLRSGYDVFDVAYSEWVVLNVSDPDKGIDFVNQRCTLQEVSVSYDALGERVVTLLLDAETDGADGVPYYPPEVAVPSDPPVFIPPPPPVTPFGRGTQRIAMFTTTGELIITNNFLSGEPTWTITDITALSGYGGGTITDFVVDAYSPRYLGTGTAVNGWFATTTRAQRILDIFGTPSLDTAATLATVAFFRNIQFERGVQNWGLAAWYIHGVGVQVARTTNGTSWSTITVNAQWDTVAGNAPTPGLWLDPHVAGHAVVTVFTATASCAGLATAAYETFDFGATFALKSGWDSGNWLAGGIAVPFTDTGASNFFHGYSPCSGTFTYRLYRNATDITPVFSGTPYGIDIDASYSARRLAICDSDANTLVMIGRPEPGNVNWGVFRTRNASGAATWETIIAPSTIPYRGVYTGDRNLAYLFGVSGAIALLDGSTVYDKQGALSTAGVVVGLCGG